MPTFDNMERGLVRVAVEKTLFDMGSADLEKVQSMLLSKHNCELDDCLEHPEALKDVLCELYGYCYNDIFKSIVEILSSGAMDTPIVNFIKSLK